MSWPLSLDFLLEYYMGLAEAALWKAASWTKLLRLESIVCKAHQYWNTFCSSVCKKSPAHFTDCGFRKWCWSAALVKKDSSAPRVALGGLWWKCTPHSKFTFFSHLANCRFLSQKVRRENCKPITQRELKQIHMVYLSALALPYHLVVINKRHNINKPQCILCACMCVRMPVFRTSDTFWNHICTLLGRSLDEIVTSTPHLQHPSAPVW